MAGVVFGADEGGSPWSVSGEFIQKRGFRGKVFGDGTTGKIDFRVADGFRQAVEPSLPIAAIGADLPQTGLADPDHGAV